MHIQFRTFQLISLSALVLAYGSAGVIAYNERLGLGACLMIGTGLFFLYAPFGLWLKTKVQGYENKSFGQVVFADNPAKKRSLSLGGLESFLHEPRELRFVIAPIWKRIMAYAIDATVAAVYICIVAGISFATTRMWGTGAVYITLIIVLILPAPLYLALRDGWNGQGLGKRLLQIQVVQYANGTPSGWFTSLCRYVILRLLGPIELIAIIAQPNHRRLGDWLCHTIVISKPR